MPVTPFAWIPRILRQYVLSGMNTKPFKLLKRHCSIDRLRKNLGEVGFEVSDVSIPDSAYEETVVTLVSERLPDDTIRIVIEKSWCPDGEDWEDTAVRLVRNEGEVVRVDLQQLLRQKLDRPLRQYVMESLLVAASEIVLP